jgi:hypothetical protein
MASAPGPDPSTDDATPDDAPDDTPDDSSGVDDENASPPAPLRVALGALRARLSPAPSEDDDGDRTDD